MTAAEEATHRARTGQQPQHAYQQSPPLPGDAALCGYVRRTIPAAADGTRTPRRPCAACLTAQHA